MFLIRIYHFCRYLSLAKTAVPVCAQASAKLTRPFLSTHEQSGEKEGYIREQE